MQPIRLKRTMSPTSGKKERIAELFFTLDSSNPSTFICRCGTRRRRSGSAYQNFLSQVQNAHPSHLDLVERQNDFNQSQLDAFSTIEKSKHLFGWMDFIINGLLPSLRKGYWESTSDKNPLRPANL